MPLALNEFGEYFEISFEELDPPGAADPTLIDFRRAIQAHVDATAQARSYDSGAACASYAASTVHEWAAEALAFIAWRDAVWTYAFAELAKIEAGTRTQPSIEDLLGELGEISWPEHTSS